MAARNRSKNNNPEGRNQYSNGWMDTAKDRPFATAATAAAAVGAGVFLWSRRNQISEQLSHLTDQISEWSENMRQGQSQDYEMADSGSLSGSSSSSVSNSSMGSTGSSRSGSSGRKSGSRGMSETGGGNASLGAHSGSSGISS